MEVMDGFKAGSVSRLPFHVARSGYEDELNDGNLPENVRQELRSHEVSVPENPAVAVEEAGERWEVSAGESTIAIVAGGDHLHFYEEDLDNSMAAAIESAFEQVWKDVKGTDLPTSGREDRRILYVAVARGVLGYLEQHAEDGFSVEVEAKQTEDTLVVCSGETDRTNDHEHQVEIDQEETSRISCVDKSGTVTVDTVDTNDG